MKTLMSSQPSSARTEVNAKAITPAGILRRSRFLLLFLLLFCFVRFNVKAALLNVTPGMLSGNFNFLATSVSGFAVPIPYGQSNNFTDGGWIWGQSDNSVLQVDFGSPQVLSQVRAWCCFPESSAGAVWAIEGSADTVTWVTMTNWNYTTSYQGGVNDDGTPAVNFGGWYGVGFNPAGLAYRYWHVKQISHNGHAPRTGAMQFYDGTTPSITAYSFAQIPVANIGNEGALATGENFSTNLVVAIQDGSVTALDTNSIHFYFNGTQVAPIITVAPPVTTITYNPPNPLTLATDTVSFAFSDNGSPVLTQSNNYIFVHKTIANVPVVSFLANEAGILTNASGNVTFLPNLLGGGGDAVPFVSLWNSYAGPTLGQVAINGVTNQSLHFNGSQELECPINGLTNGSLFILMKSSWPANANDRRVIGLGNSHDGRNGLEVSPQANNLLQIYARSNTPYGSGGADIGDTTTANTNNIANFFELVTVTWGPSGVSLYRNGNQLNHSAQYLGLSADPAPILLKIGATGRGFNSWFQGDILALSVYNSQLDDVTRATVETNLMQSFNLAELSFIATATTLESATNIQVRFSQVLNSGSATTIGNYTLNNGNSVIAASLNSAGTIVTLTLASPIYYLYTNILTVNSLVDNYGDTITPNTSGTIALGAASSGPTVDHISFAPVLPTGEIFNPPNTNLVIEVQPGSLTAIDTNTVHFFLNGTEVPAIITTQAPFYTEISYNPPGPLPVGSNTVTFVFSDSGSPAVARTNNYSFILKNISSVSEVSFLANEAGILTNATGNVTFLPNLAGGGADAAQVLGVNNLGPTLGTVVIGGVTNQSLHFNGSQELESPITCYPNGSLFILMKHVYPLSVDDQRVIGWGNSQNGLNGVDLSASHGNKLNAYVRQGVNSNSGDATDPENVTNEFFELVTLTWGPNGTLLYRNGNLLMNSFGVDGATGDSPPLFLKVGATGRGGASWFGGDVLALKVYNTQLDDATRSSVETNLMQTFNLPELSIAAAGASTQVEVSFSEPLDLNSTSANTAANYTITNGNGSVSVTAASLNPNNTTVTLTLASPIYYTDTNILTVNNVVDNFGNTIPANSTALIHVFGAPAHGPSVIATSFAQVLAPGIIFNPPNTNLWIEVQAGDVTVLNTNTTHFFLNGTEVATTITTVAPYYTFITYNPPGNLPAGSNTVSLVFSDNGSPAVTQTNNYSFILKYISTVGEVSFLANEAGILTNATGNVTFLPNLAGGGANAAQVLGITNLGPTLGTVTIAGKTCPTLHFNQSQVQQLECPIECYSNGTAIVLMRNNNPLTVDYQRVLGWGNSQNGVNGVELSPSHGNNIEGNVRNGVNTGSGDVDAPINPAINGTFELVTLSWGPNGVLLYHNGQPVATNTVNTAGATPDSPPLLLKIGVTGRGGGNPFGGDLLALHIYNTQLNDATRSSVETGLLQSINLAGQYTFTSSGGNGKITWNTGGTLQSSTNVLGPYADVIGAIFPYTSPTTNTFPMTNTATFYRMRF